MRIPEEPFELLEATLHHADGATQPITNTVVTVRKLTEVYQSGNANIRLDGEVQIAFVFHCPYYAVSGVRAGPARQLSRPARPTPGLWGRLAAPLGEYPVGTLVKVTRCRFDYVPLAEQPVHLVQVQGVADEIEMVAP